MNIILVLSDDFLDYTILDKSSEAPNFAVNRIKAPERRDEEWKTTGIGDEWVIFDFGAAKQINAVALINVNFTQYKIQGNATSDFASPAFDSGIITVSKEHFTMLYRSYINPQSFGAFNYRYLRIFIPAQTPVDGATYFSVGGVIISALTQEILRNPLYGASISIEPIELEQSFLSGRVERIKRRNNFRRIRLRFPFDVDRSSSAEFQMLLSKLNHNRGILVYIAGGALREYTDTSSLVFLVDREGQAEYTIDNWGTSRIEFFLREMI